MYKARPIEDLFKLEFPEFTPDIFLDDEVIVAVCWAYGVSPNLLSRLYIQYIDGVS